MPIEIRELQITAVVQEQQETTAGNVSEKQKMEIIAECVEQVMELIREERKKER